jgi:hypothetical protein
LEAKHTKHQQQNNRHRCRNEQRSQTPEPIGEKKEHGLMSGLSIGWRGGTVQRVLRTKLFSLSEQPRGGEPRSTSQPPATSGSDHPPHVMASQGPPFKMRNQPAAHGVSEYDQMLDQGTAIVKLFLGAAKVRRTRRTRSWFAIVSLAGGLLFLILDLADRVWNQTPTSHYAPATAGASQPG